MTLSAGFVRRVWSPFQEQSKLPAKAQVLATSAVREHKTNRKTVSNSPFYSGSQGQIDFLRRIVNRHLRTHSKLLDW